MRLTIDQIAAIADRKPNANMASTLAGLERAGVGAGLERPHRLAMYLAQLAHESMGWRYDRELWGPTAAQKRYDTRTDLGNTPAADGDGYLYRGRGPIQLTGKYNYSVFTHWAQSMMPDAPDFVRNPDAVNTDPWEGLVAIWYWDSRNINRHADKGDFRAVTKAINGGYNGLADRERYYTRAALVLLGHRPTDIAGFQQTHRIKVDGIAGPNTRAALHKALLAKPPVSFGDRIESLPPRDEATKEDRPVSVPVSNMPPAAWLLIGVGLLIVASMIFGG